MPGASPRSNRSRTARRNAPKRLHKELVEKAAENDEALMEHYFEKGELDEDEMRIGLKKGMMARTCFPVFCLSALRNMGSGRLMGFIDNVAPARSGNARRRSGGWWHLECKADGPAVLFTFKTVIEPRAGHVTLFKVMSGEVTEGMDLVNDNTGGTERINQLFIVDGKERKPVEKLVAGDIGGTIKLKDTSTAHTLHTPGKADQTAAHRLPRATAAPHHQGGGPETGGETACCAVGDPEGRPHHGADLQPRDRATTRGRPRRTAPEPAEVEAEPPLQGGSRVRQPAHPLPRDHPQAAEASYRHKKQTGGSGQFGEVHLKIEPWYEGMPEPEGRSVRGKEVHELPTGGKLVFYNCIVGGVIDNKFMPSILKGVMEKMEKWPADRITRARHPRGGVRWQDASGGQQRHQLQDRRATWPSVRRSPTPIRS
jgi:elongation factor G